MRQNDVVIMEELNVNYAGEIWDGKKKYQMVIISQFNSDDKEVIRKVFYFDRHYELNLSQARYILGHFPNCSKIRTVEGVAQRVF